MVAMKIQKKRKIKVLDHNGASRDLPRAIDNPHVQPSLPFITIVIPRLKWAIISYFTSSVVLTFSFRVSL